MRKIFPKQKKGEIGILTSLVLGTISLIVAVIIGYVIVDTLVQSNLFTENRQTATYTNETTTALNQTGVTLAGASLIRPTCSIVSVYNKTGPMLISPVNYTTTSYGDKIGCILKLTTIGDANTGINNSLYNVTYTVKYAGTVEASAVALNTNFTNGVGNVSEKLPTILLIAAVVLLFGVLVLLVEAYRRMRIGGEGEGGGL